MTISAASVRSDAKRYIPEYHQFTKSCRAKMEGSVSYSIIDQALTFHAQYKGSLVGITFLADVSEMAIKIRQ